MEKGQTGGVFHAEEKAANAKHSRGMLASAGKPRRFISMKGTKHTKRRLPTMSLYPLKAEEALAAFMRADPAKVREEMKKLRRKRG